MKIIKRLLKLGIILGLAISLFNPLKQEAVPAFNASGSNVIMEIENETTSNLTPVKETNIIKSSNTITWEPSR